MNYDIFLQKCPICFEKIQENEIATTSCKHYYHSKCLNKWLSTKNTCPICRLVLHKDNKPIRKILTPEQWNSLDSFINERFHIRTLTFNLLWGNSPQGGVMAGYTDPESHSSNAGDSFPSV